MVGEDRTKRPFTLRSSPPGPLGFDILREVMRDVGHIPRLHRGGADNPARSLLSWDRLATIIAERPHLGSRRDTARVRHTGAIRRGSSILEIAREGRPLERSEWARGAQGAIDGAALVGRLRGGASLFMRRIEEFVPEVATWIDHIERDLDAPANAVAVASFRTTPGAALHLDAEDGLILQCEGRKRWLIHRPTRVDAFPSGLDAMAPPPTGEPDLDLVLEAGDVLHVPRGWWHRVVPLDEPSLHLTFNVFRRTGVDFFDWIAVDALPPSLLDTPLDDPDVVSRLHEQLGQLCSVRGVAAFRAEIRHDPPLLRPRLSLPRQAR